DLAALATACDGELGCAVRAGGAVLSPALAWLLHPAPKGTGAVTVRFRGAGAVASGLRRAAAGRDDRTRAFVTHDLDEGSFTAFGPARRMPVAVDGGAIDLVMLGAPLAFDDARAARWLADAAGVVARLFGR